MTCILDMDQAIAQVTERLGGLFNNVSEEDQKALNKIDQVWVKAVGEIGDGELKQETCEKISALMIGAEGRAKLLITGPGESLNMYEGLKRIHDEMQLIANQFGANEGQKECCPFCEEDC